MTDFTRKSDTEWTWLRGQKTLSVRYFPSTERLIWSGWVDTPDGPLFDEGFAQPVQNFLQDGAPPHMEDIPQSLLDALKSALTEQTQSAQGGFFGKLFGRKG